MSDALDDIDVLIEQAAGAVRDPYPDFAARRRATPVVAEEGFGGYFLHIVYRYADVATVLRDGDTFSSKVYAPAIGAVFGPSFIQMDGAEHQRKRAVVGGAFRRTLIADWEHTLIEPTVHQLIDAFAARGTAELVRELTIRFPIRIIARILGIPTGDDDRFARLSIQLIGIVGDLERGMAASRALGEYFAELLAERRRAPADDVISMLATAEVDGAPLPDDEIFGFLRLLLPAGAETTYRLLGNLLFGLLTHPEQLDALRADRSLLPRAIEEALRWESPVQFVSREPVRDVVLGGVEIPAGGHVSCSIGSANHDDEVFDDPEQFDIFRDAATHLAFAEGPHRCLGEHLARVETTVAMNAILDRLTDIHLDPGDADPHVQGHVFRSPTSLPVRFTPS